MTMIARLWRGATRAEDADRYVRYQEGTGLAEYRGTPGNRAAMVLRRIVDGKAEFLYFTLWESRDSIRRFAGPDPERAVFYPEDDEFLVDRDEHVSHYEVVYFAADPGLAPGTPAEGPR